MTYPRSMSVNLEATPYYHVVGRCVRRAWLWGVDEYSGKGYSHRKQWILDRLSQLCGVFAINCATYAVMSSHYHLTLGVDAGRRFPTRHRHFTADRMAVPVKLS